MKEFLLIVLITFSGAASFGQTESGQIKEPSAIDPKSSDANSEEYKIYLTALAGKTETFVVRDKTDIDRDSKNFASLESRGFTNFLGQINSDTKADFLKKNENPVNLDKISLSDLEYVFISTAELKEKFAYKFDGEMNWEAFREKYPKARNLYTLSRVGFSADRRQALVFVTNWGGSACGEGNYLLLRKENDGWKIVNKIMIWIS